MVYVDLIERIFSLFPDLTQQEIGDMLDISRDTVSLWYRRKSNPTFKQLKKIVSVSGVNWDWLIDGKNIPHDIILNDECDSCGITFPIEQLHENKTGFICINCLYKVCEEQRKEIESLHEVDNGNHTEADIPHNEVFANAYRTAHKLVCSLYDIIREQRETIEKLKNGNGGQKTINRLRDALGKINDKLIDGGWVFMSNGNRLVTEGNWNAAEAFEVDHIIRQALNDSVCEDGGKE